MAKQPNTLPTIAQNDKTVVLFYGFIFFHFFVIQQTCPRLSSREFSYLQNMRPKIDFEISLKVSTDIPLKGFH